MMLQMQRLWLACLVLATCSSRVSSLSIQPSPRASADTTTTILSSKNNNNIIVGPYDSALSMALAIKDGRVTSRQLVEMYIDRIERLDGGGVGKLNAVVQRDFESARNQADAADEKVQEWRKKKSNSVQLGPFHGVPMTIKESNPTPGFRMTGGDPMLQLLWFPKWASSDTTRNMIHPDADSGGGGAILLGKTNQPINACDWEVNNPIYGRTGNPYDTSKSPGGSSGGAAAALAAGLTAMEIGSDIGGSIRIPAVMCGVVGHVATREVSPAMNVVLGNRWIDNYLAKMLQDLVWMGRAGPMARSADDVIAMLEVFVGKENAKTLPRPNNNNKERSKLSEYRIAIWRSHEICPPGKEVKGAFDKAVAALRKAGAMVEELQPPMDPQETYKIYLIYLSQFMKMNMPKEQKRNAKEGRPHESYPSDIKSPFADMDMASINGIPDGTQQVYDKAMRAWDGYLSKYDAVLSPIFPSPAWPNESEPRDRLSDAKVLSRTLMVDDEARYYGDSIFWSHLSVLLGLPATGFPVGFTTNKQEGGRPLPVGLQVMGARLNDFILLDIVQKLMKVLGTDKFQPPYGFE